MSSILDFAMFQNSYIRNVVMEGSSTVVDYGIVDGGERISISSTHSNYVFNTDIIGAFLVTACMVSYIFYYSSSHVYTVYSTIQ